MSGSSVPESVPVCVLRLSEDDFDVLCRWFVQVMSLAGIQKSSQREVMKVILAVENIIRNREEAPTTTAA